MYDGHDKTFFFFAYEPRWRRDFLTVSALVPTAAQRAGDFSNLVRTASGFLPADVAARFQSQTTAATPSATRTSINSSSSSAVG